MDKDIQERISRIKHNSAAVERPKESPTYEDWNTRKTAAARDMARVMTSRSRTQILKALQAGEPIEDILLLVIDVLSDISDDSLFKRQAKSALYAVYGDEKREKRPQELRIVETIITLENLKEAKENEKEGQSKAKIQSAIDWIENVLAGYQNQYAN